MTDPVYQPRALLLPVVLLLAAAAMPRAISGQEPTAPPAGPAGNSPSVIRERTPELYYLKDDSGRLVPVPGFRYADFLELFRIREGLGGPVLPPAAVLESVIVTIDARRLEPRAASCPIKVECRVRQARGGWAMVPLDLGQVLLDAPPEHDGPGRMLVDADPAGKGYRCWFEPAADAGGDLRHTVRLAGRLPVESGQEQDAFALSLPLAVTSRLEIDTARAAPQVTLRPAARGRVEVADTVDGGRVTVTGVSGDLRLLLAAAAPASEALAESDCESVVRIDGRIASITARLRLTNLPPSLSQVVVTLPPGAMLRQVAGDGILVPGADTDGTVTIAVARDPGRAAEIDLVCEHPIDASDGTPFEPLGFAVAGVEPWRQRGRANLVIEGDWQATWDTVPGIRRVDPPAGAREAGLVAAFAYDAQPASLPLRISPRGSRVVIEPEYRYAVSAARIELEARLRVAARGAPVDSISLELDPEWRIGEVGPAGVVDAAGVRVEGNRIAIPFVQPLAGDAVVEIAAARSIEPAAEQVAWSLPRPRADLVGPASVLVSSDPDIELLPDAAHSLGLVRQTASALAPGDADRIALVYRLEAGDGTFAATRRFLPRRVEASIATRVVVDDREVAVSETIRLDVLHVPLEFLELRLAETVLDAGTLEIRQGGDLLDPAEIEDAGDVDAVGRPLKLVRVLLPVPLLGRGQVTVQYRVPTPAVPPETTVAVDLPLPLPVVSGAIRQSATIEEAATLLVVPRSEVWRRDVAGPPGGSRSWSVSKPKDLFPLALSARTREAASVTVVEAAWLRTRLFPDRREDVAIYVVAPAEPRLEIDLPAAPPAASLEVRLDGSRVAATPRDDGRLVVDMPPGGGSRLLEIRTTAPWGGTIAGLGLPWPLRLDAPRFASDVLQRQFAWEVALLPTDHLLGMPARWTRQQRWAWRGLGWRSEPTVAPGEFGDWIAATLRRPAVTVSAVAAREEPRFVYAGIGPPGAAAAWVVPAWLLVLVCSGASLALGLTMLYSASWRKPAVVVGLVAAGTLLATALPESLPLVGQAAFPGGVLALLAAAIRRFSEPAPPRRVAGQPTSQASSLTRSVVPAASLIVAPSTGSAAAVGGGRDGA
jgi:hypothetical protein